MKTADLIGRPLDYAVALALGGEGLSYDGVGTWWIKIDGVDRALSGGWAQRFCPSTDMAVGGPIIEREKVSVAYEPSLLYDDSCRWKAMKAMSDNGHGHEYGPTLLIAAMRCIVGSEFGDDIEIPEGL